MKIHILGDGTMGRAIANGLEINNFEVVLVGREPKSSNEFQKELYGTKYDISGKNIILAFKSHALGSMKNVLYGTAKICISVLARTDLITLKNAIKAENHTICLPNIAAKFALSITPFLSSTDETLVETILNGFGKAIKMGSQDELDIASVIAGCSPAFLAVVAEALSNAGVKGGLKTKDAKMLVSGLFGGFSELLKESHPALLKEAVCSPGGTTIEGVAKLEEYGVRNAFFKAVEASHKKQKN